MAPRGLVVFMEALYRVLEKDRDSLAYLSMMAVRLLELHRVLRPTGSLYLHCDPTASHYLKVILDAIFGAQRFMNEVVWKRTTTVKGNFGQGTKAWGAATDSILFYAKSDVSKFTQPFRDYSKEYQEKAYRFVEPDTGRRYRLVSMIGPGGAAKGNPFYEVLGVKRYWRYSRQKMQDLIDAGLVVQTKPGTVPNRKYYLDEGKGVPVQSLWDDIGNLQASDAERIGYPTQKPRALLERIVAASSDPGDVVLDPFCGCGTTIEACANLGREWIGIDVAPKSVDIIRKRMLKIGVEDLKVVGWPMDLEGATRLAHDDKVGFQRWAVFMAGGRLPDGRQYKGGADGGIDGEVMFDDSGKRFRAIISVKGGGVGANDIRVLRNVVEDTRSQMGIFLSMQESTKAMREIARDGGFFTAANGEEFRKIQLLTAKDLLSGEGPRLPGRNVTPDSVRSEPRKGETLTLPFAKARNKTRGTPTRATPRYEESRSKRPKSGRGQ